MVRRVVAGVTAVIVMIGVLEAQQPNRPMSPEGSAQAQVLGKWTKGERPAFTLGRETYVGGKWIEITYGRPLHARAVGGDAGAGVHLAVQLRDQHEGEPRS